MVSMAEYFDAIKLDGKEFQYISSGVCMVNLDQARKHDYVNQAILLNNRFWHISSFVNYLGYDGLGYLPVKYHIGKEIFRHQVDRIPYMYPDEEIEDAYNHPAIIHWTSAFCPDGDNPIYHVEEWKKYQKEIFSDNQE